MDTIRIGDELEQRGRRYGRCGAVAPPKISRGYLLGRSVISTAYSIKPRMKTDPLIQFQLRLTSPEKFF